MNGGRDPEEGWIEDADEAGIVILTTLIGIHVSVTLVLRSAAAVRTCVYARLRPS